MISVPQTPALPVYNPAPGFKNLPQRVYDKTISYDEGLQRLGADKHNREDFYCEFDSIKPTVNAEGKFVLERPDTGRQYTLTPHALSQLGQLCGVGSSFFHTMTTPRYNPNGKLMYERNEMHHKVAAMVAAVNLSEQPQQMLFRARNDGNIGAILSNLYSPIDIEWFFNVIMEAIPDGRFMFYRGNSDEVYTSVVIPDNIRDFGDNESFQGGLSLSNSEIGTRRLGLSPWLMRLICTNGNMGKYVGVTMKKVHRGKIDLTTLRLQLISCISDQIPLLPALMEKLFSTRNLTTDVNMKVIIAEISKEQKLTKKQASGILKAYFEEELVGPARSLYGLINSITRFAHASPDNVVWTGLETMAGGLMEYSANDWTRLTNRAAGLSVKEVEKVYANAV